MYACRVTITCNVSKVGNSKRSYYIYRSYLDLGYFFLPIHCFYWINCEKTQFRGTFLRCSENSRWTRNETTKLQENMFSCHTVNRIILGKICILNVWYSSVNFLLAFGNHVWKPLVLELGNDFIQLLILCSSYWIKSQLALYNRLHSLLISKLTIFSTAYQFRQLYHNEN